MEFPSEEVLITLSGKLKKANVLITSGNSLLWTIYVGNVLRNTELK
jgi:hypothetical protein